MLTAHERETVVTTSDGDELVRIWTAQRTVIHRLRKHPAFTETRSGHDGSSVWAEFTIPADRWSPATGAKRRVTLSAAQNEANTARLRAINQARQVTVSITPPCDLHSQEPLHSEVSYNRQVTP